MFNVVKIRILWIFMFAFGLMFSTYLCWGMVNKFYSSPVSAPL